MEKNFVAQEYVSPVTKFKADIAATLEAKKRMFLTKEILERLKKVMNTTEYERFLKLCKSVSYEELQEIFNYIYQSRCVQKVCSDYFTQLKRSMVPEYETKTFSIK